MTIINDYFLKNVHTFHIPVYAKHFATFASADELRAILNYANDPATPKLVLGGGSNILFTKNFNGLILKNEINGVEIINEDDNHIYVRVGAGENWHRFVMYCIAHGFAGVENLSLIPGNTGASPMQNIGAYGVEIKDMFHELEAYNLEDKQIHKFTNYDCEFGYRESVFKTRLRNRYVILSVTFRLNKKPHYNISYGAIEQELEKMNVQQLSIKAISDAVINIRTKKLPDPNVIGNAGSFFKNPELSETVFHQLKEKYSTIAGFKMPGDKVKLAAGWLIEQCGPEKGISWKGYRKGDAGCYSQQALVLVNYGNAAGNEIYALSEEIKQSVKEKFGVELEREVNII